MKITEYDSIHKFNSDTIILTDGGSAGTKKIAVSEAASSFINSISPEAHRCIFRGKELGSSVTSDQKTAIQSGTFDDIFIGDYWKINNIIWRVADIDYFYNTGDSDHICKSHHVVIVPDSCIGTSKAMNESKGTEGGYYGSEMYTTNLEEAKGIITEAFTDGLILNHREILTNTVTEGHPSGGSWYDSKIELMNEIMVYGSYVFTPKNDGKTVPHLYTVSKTQFALFQLCPKFITNRSTYWLRDAVSASNFANVHSYGYTTCNPASYIFGVRPEFAIG